MANIKCELYHDNNQNFKQYNIPKAQLILTDIPYNIAENAYASNPQWYEGGDMSNGQSEFAGKTFFARDEYFKCAEFMHFATQILRPEPKEVNQAPCMIVFCNHQQFNTLITYAEKYGFKHYQLLCFIKDYSPQVLKANMRIVGATEYALLFYRDKLPKFRNKGKMIFDWFRWSKDDKMIPKIHPTQKPIAVLSKLIETFTDKGDVVVDPCAGSASTLRAAYMLERNSFGFEVDGKIYHQAKTLMLNQEDLSATARRYKEKNEEYTLF